MKVSLLLATVFLGGCLIAQADVGDGKQAPPPLRPHLTPILNPNSHPRLTTIRLRLRLITMGCRSLSADFPRLFSVLTSGDRVISGVTGGFITRVIFAVTEAAVTTTDTRGLNEGGSKRNNGLNCPRKKTDYLDQLKAGLEAWIASSRGAAMKAG
jgi:hypothetical protein